MRTYFIGLCMVLLLGLIGGSSYYIQKSRAATIDTNRRYAVSLVDGTVYFAHITSINENFITLKDVYYTPKDGLSTEGDKKKLKIVRFTDALYSPDNTLTINRERVAHFAPLTLESKINEAINQGSATQ